MGFDGRAGRVRIAFVLTALELGGAEMMLWKVLSRLDRGRFEPIVVALSSGSGSLAGQFREAGIRCEFLGMQNGIDAATGLFRLRSALRALQPDIVQGWMYQGNLAATLGASLARLRRPVLWSVRAGLTDLSQEKWRVALPIWLGARLSSLPQKIINNSIASALEHEQSLGYRAEKRLILPNGFDVDLFKPSPEARAAIRAALGIPDDAVLIGLVARFHPVKGHPVFLRAAQELSRDHPHVHYLLAGTDIEHSNPQLEKLIQACDLADRIHLLGRRADMHAVTAVLDIAVSASETEAFSNVIGEAMSCAVPCAVTDVGDSAAIVGDTGKVVPRNDADALARALRELIAIGPAARMTLGLKARQRIIDTYSLDAVVQQYEALYSGVHEACRSRTRH